MNKVINNIKLKFKNIIPKIKKILSKIKNGIIKFFKKKINRIMVLVIALILVIVLVIALVNKRKDNLFVLNHIYDIYPEEVRELYANMVSISCNGDLYFNVSLVDNFVKVEDIDKNILMDYMFSHLDKNKKLNDEFDSSLIKDTSKKLFNSNIDLLNDIKDYQYGNYVYNLEDNKITRKKKECVSSSNYVSHLYGYSWNSDMLSIDVNIGYLKDGILYDLSDNKLGEYDGDQTKLFDLFASNSFYRLGYVRNNGVLKLDSVKLMNRS